MVSKMQHLKRLKTILQSNYFYYVLIILTIIYVIFMTIIIKYKTNINDFTTLEGIITKINYDDNKISFILKNNEKIICTYYIKEKDNLDLLGKKVLITGKKNDFYNNTIPNTFNYKNYLYNNKIYLSIKVDNIKVLKDENILYKIKNNLTKRINSYDKEVKTYLNLFILGNKDYLSDDMANIYKTNGIWHLFAISGMHIGLLILILNKLLNKVKGQKIIISLFLIYYAFLANFTASVLRVVTFYILKNILNRLNINTSSFKTLLLCATFLIIINPFIIYNVGFIYSFAISFALILMNDKIKGNYFQKIFKISLLAFLVSLPITINLNYEINILSIFLNIIYVPLISLIVFPLSIITLLIPLFNPLLVLLIKLLECSSQLFYSFKLNIIIPKMFAIIIIIYYFILFLIYRSNKKYLCFILFLLLLINKSLYKLDSNYYVYFLDVGQGDSSLLISPYKNEVIMIDTGGSINSSYHVSDNTIKFLKSIGIRKVDLLILSHGDADHAKETLNLINKFKIENIIINNGNINELESQIIKEGNVVKDYQSSYFNYINIDKYYNDSENESSIISYFNILNNKLLFMGDTSKNIELKLINEYLLKADIIKIAHHGSKTSSDYQFLKNINPSLAIISSGRNNIYHHPSSETLSSLDDLNIKYLNTQTSGSIRVTINTKGHTIKEFKP